MVILSGVDSSGTPNPRYSPKKILISIQNIPMNTVRMIFVKNCISCQSN